MKRSFIFTLAMSIALSLACTSNVLAGIETSFLYELSDFSGSVPYNWPGISVDEERSEILVVDREQTDIAIFNDQGMEIYSFGDDGNLGAAIDVAPDKEGNILVLSENGSNVSIIKCNFRGEPIAQLELKNFPSDFFPFAPSRIVYRQGLLYLLDSIGLRVAVTDANGFFQNGYDLGSLAGIKEDKREQVSIGGFSVDFDGNILFTIPTKFAAYILSPNGNLRKFGKHGGAPGKFNNIGGIVADAEGYYYVADKLKSAILVFDKDFKFQFQFGYAGSRPENLIIPNGLAVDSQGRLYVSQRGGRGVSVFQITYR